MTEPPPDIRAMVEQWELRPDGPTTHGSGALLLPVRTADGAPAVLKVSFPDAESKHAHLVLRRWAGTGAVRLLRADPHHRAVLLERLRPQDLDTLADTEACEVIAGLQRRVHVPALPQLRSLTSYVEQWAHEFEALPRSAPIPRRLVEQAVALSRDLVADPTGADVVLHGDLHYGNVLAADREPWLAIAPRPLNGDPHFELAPMLWHRWDEFAGHIRDGVRARFYMLVDAGALDEQRARAWAVVRVVHEATRALGAGSQSDTSTLTRFVTLAKALQD
ncbi:MULTISPECIES: aminoglycoside phosphotransferase family protein [unclassified Mycobacterium]|uniref:aminoglycoside phosphotransferase family protein n=1 Tax=unclassified Mycobacterium TaxID=2642494 RepID=UPI0029C9451D|nr:MULTISPECIES: aminoglycoside phosphotransferase family protein [unclassified Mycobacterium]